MQTNIFFKPEQFLCRICILLCLQSKVYLDFHKVSEEQHFVRFNNMHMLIQRGGGRKKKEKKKEQAFVKEQKDNILTARSMCTGQLEHTNVLSQRNMSGTVKSSFPRFYVVFTYCRYTKTAKISSPTATSTPGYGIRFSSLPCWAKRPASKPNRAAMLTFR